MQPLEQRTVKDVSSLLKRTEDHLKLATGVLETEQPEIVRNYNEILPTIPVQSVMSFLESVTRDSTELYALGEKSKRPEGLIFSALEKDHQPKVVKLYDNTGIFSFQLEQVLATLYSEPSLNLLMRAIVKKFTKRDSLIALIAKKLSESQGSPKFFASGEILVRAMAHSLMPDMMPMPVALVNDYEEPVGFYLEQDKLVQHASNMARNESYEMFKEYMWRDDLEPVVAETQQILEKGNVLVWQNNWEDLEGMLLLDADYRFVNFARLGYLAYGVDIREEYPNAFLNSLAFSVLTPYTQD